MKRRGGFAVGCFGVEALLENRVTSARIAWAGLVDSINLVTGNLGEFRRASQYVVQLLRLNIGIIVSILIKYRGLRPSNGRF